MIFGLVLAAIGLILFLPGFYLPVLGGWTDYVGLIFALAGAVFIAYSLQD